jgi:hypothetical protein
LGSEEDLERRYDDPGCFFGAATDVAEGSDGQIEILCRS